MMVSGTFLDGAGGFIVVLMEETNTKKHVVNSMRAKAARFTMPVRCGSKNCRERLKFTVQPLWMSSVTWSRSWLYTDGGRPRFLSYHRLAVKTSPFLSGMSME